MADPVQAALLSSLGIPQPNASPATSDAEARFQQRTAAITGQQGQSPLDSIVRQQFNPPVSQSPALGGSSGGPLSVGSGRGAQAVALAMSHRGTPYQWGGNNLNGGIDCSGLVQQVYGQLGVHLGRTTYDQVNQGQGVPSLDQAQPGDLVFLHPDAGGPGHVGIYAGNGQMVDANHTGGWVDLRPIAGYGGIVAIRRVI